MSEEGNKTRTKKLFQTAYNLDRNYRDVQEALKKIEEVEIRSTGDWFDLWFCKSSWTFKEGHGHFLVYSLIRMALGWSVQNSVYPYRHYDNFIGIAIYKKIQAWPYRC